MSAFLPGLPEPAEYNPAFGGYIGKRYPSPIRSKS